MWWSVRKENVPERDWVGSVSHGRPTRSRRQCLVVEGGWPLVAVVVVVVFVVFAVFPG